jgi:hypothetical protein
VSEAMGLVPQPILRFLDSLAGPFSTRCIEFSGA